MRRFWTDFEKFTNCKYPSVLKKILNLCAIDRSTFSDINEQIIVQIEQIVNENQSVLKNSVYANVSDGRKNFKFLFGHRLSLLNLPEKYKKNCEKEKLKKKSRQARSLKLKVGDNENLLENLEDPSDDDISGPLEPNRIKNSLITKLNKTAQKKFGNKYS